MVVSWWLVGSLFIFLLFGSSLFSVQTCTNVSRKVILCPFSVQAGSLPTGNWWRLDTHADLQRTCKQGEISPRMPRPRWTADARAAGCSRAADSRAADGGGRGATALPARGHLGSAGRLAPPMSGDGGHAGRVTLPASGDGGGRGATALPRRQSVVAERAGTAACAARPPSRRGG